MLLAGAGVKPGLTWGATDDYCYNITTPDQTDRLVWNPFCVQNLAKFVHDLLGQHHEAQKRVKPEARRKKTVGVVARGCTTRSLVIQLQEKQ